MVRFTKNQLKANSFNIKIQNFNGPKTKKKKYYSSKKITAFFGGKPVFGGLFLIQQDKIH